MSQHALHDDVTSEQAAEHADSLVRVMVEHLGGARSLNEVRDTLESACRALHAAGVEPEAVLRIVKHSLARAAATTHTAGHNEALRTLKARLTPWVLAVCFEIPVTVPTVLTSDARTDEDPSEYHSQMRLVKGDGSRVWHLTELPGRTKGGVFVPATLLASADTVIRRIWSYPANWYQLNNARLLELISSPVHRG